jgi:hypothetical protein
MSGWNSDELDRIGGAEELELASVRGDDTRRRLVPMWVVRVGDDVYVRSVKGRTGWWFHRAQDRHEAYIEAGGVEKDVELVETDELSDEIDTAYRAKYRRYAANILNSVLTPDARAATLKLVPRP